VSNAHIARDHDHPGERVALGRIVEVGLLPNPQKTLLQNVAGQVALAGYAQAQCEELRRNAIIKLTKGNLVAHGDAADE
jgi:hypothetical protein